MSNQENYTDMIDAYLTGQLNQEDASRFMERLEQDPALKDEFLLQQDIVQSLQAKRKSELKARLDNINVGSGSTIPGGGAMALKMVAGTALVALMGTGIYFAFNESPAQHEETLNQVEIRVQDTDALAINEVPEKPSVDIQAENSAIPVQPNPLEDEKNASGKAANTPSVAPLTPKKQTKEFNQKSEKPNEIAAAETAEVVKPDVISFFDEQDPSSNTPEADTPEDKLNTIRNFSTQNIEVTTVSDSKYAFHYMFYNNQLHIYGEFSKVPYEVLEVNSGSYTKYFLFHNGLYYELNPKQREVTRLKELKNEGMIQELEITRNEKLKR